MSEECVRDKDIRVNILGEIWTVVYRNEEEDDYLKENDGYCDRTVREIVVAELKNDKGSVRDLKEIQRTVLRHEIVHAFLFESGLGGAMEHKPFGHEETMVDWFALQGEKIYRAWATAGAVEGSEDK